MLPTPKEVPNERPNKLEPAVEMEITSKLLDGVRSWIIDEDWLLVSDDITANAALSGWAVKFSVKPTEDPEVKNNWIKFTPIK